MLICSENYCFLGSDVNNSGGRAVQLVSPLQTNGSQITGLTPIVVTQNCTGTSMAQFIGSPSQLTGKVNIMIVFKHSYHYDMCHVYYIY